MLAPFPPVRGTLRTLAAHRLAGTLDWAKLVLMPANALADRLFSHEGAKAWLFGAAMHGDVPPQGAGQRDRRRAPERDGPLRRLAEPRGRRRVARRGR